ncbi:polysaccharide biosynthesis protein [Acinetobacter sp. B5B]|uniref:polysaccharide biosynthesis protein n=1 Tax=Acinetobacter baretiae TaxID=2605383 RepID=UPI0018C1F54B|nr:polysaccharide biosynthesis protein [Acinetobacter baretiae]MBF7682648.1 polysaccharide biosynthesis protein [Acinetobacter baretiae]
MNFKILNIFNSAKIKNSMWMILEKIVSIFGVIFVTSFVAKYIGPDNFGKLTLTSSIFAIIQTVAMFGLENIIFHQTARNPLNGEKLILAGKKIRDIIFFSLTSAVLFYLYVTMDTLVFIFSVSTSIAVYFALHDVYSIYFNAILKSRVNTICNSIGLIIALSFRYVIAEFELNVEYLSIPIILTTFVPYLLRSRIYKKRSKLDKKNISIKVIKKYRIYMLGVGRKLLLYSLSVAIFTKTSQIFLGWQSTYELGLYTVVSTLGGCFYFLYNALISSFMSEIYQERSILTSQKMVAKLNLIIILIGLLFLILTLFFGSWVLNILYGEQYLSVSQYLPLTVLTCVFSGIATVVEKFIIKFQDYSFLQKKTNILLVINITLTFFLVNNFGLKGAIYSVLLTELITATLLNYFYKSGFIWKTHLKTFSPSTYTKQKENLKS